jgi:hypothetical protein
MPDPFVERIVEVLGAPTSALRDEVVAVYVDQLLAQRLRDTVELDKLVALVLRTIDRQNVARTVDKHVLPGFERVTQHFATASESVGDLVSEEGKRALRAALAKPVRVRGRWLKGAIDPKLVQRLLGPIWVQLLVSFARRIPVPGLGGGSSPQAGATAPQPTAAAAPPRGGIAGMLGRGVQQSAERLASAGRSALEGLGIDLETKLTAAAKDFSEGAVGVWNQAMAERLSSEDGKAAMLQIKLGVLEHVLRTPLRDLHEDATGIASTPYFAIAPTIIAHAVTTAFVSGNIERELQQFMSVEGDRSLRELLAEQGILEDVRVWLLQRAGAGFGELTRTPAFAAWLTRVIAAGQPPETT